MKQSNSPLSGKPALFWLQPLAGRMCWVHRGRRSGARSSWGEPRPGTQDSLPPARVHWRKVPLKWPCEPVRPLKGSALHSPHSQTLRKEASSAPPPASPVPWQTCRWLVLKAAKITFPGKCFHLQKRTLREILHTAEDFQLFKKQINLFVNKQACSSFHGLTISF
uniref:Uncharacterized protein n=1 Tax=Pipistrellus kuhlii TaxID=59472 RepID=A0A7J7YWX4_PIPKU|nr:hypothetical protein mPipKuh1_009925 [Pipistrellus kuhlii]